MFVSSIHFNVDLLNLLACFFMHPPLAGEGIVFGSSLHPSVHLSDNLVSTISPERVADCL